MAKHWKLEGEKAKWVQLEMTMTAPLQPLQILSQKLDQISHVQDVNPILNHSRSVWHVNLFSTQIVKYQHFVGATGVVWLGLGTKTTLLVLGKDHGLG